MYIEKRTERSHVLLQKNQTFSRSFPFFAKESCVLCVLFRSLEKNGKEQNVLLGLISRQKLEKRTEKNGTFFFKNGKEHNVPNGKERSAQFWYKVAKGSNGAYFFLHWQTICPHGRPKNSALRNNFLSF